MNKFQKIIAVLAVANLVLVALFPPFNDLPLRKGVVGSFEGFYPIFSMLGRKPLNTNLFSIEIFFVVANALAAWLALGRLGPHAKQAFNYSGAICAFAVVNMGIILLFPPFEFYSSLTKSPSGSFESFYFAFGARSQRPVFIPLLYLETVFVMTNALIAWLLFNVVRRTDESLEDEVLDIASDLNPQEMLHLSEELRQKALAAAPPPPVPHPQRPHAGPERRRHAR